VVGIGPEGGRTGVDLGFDRRQVILPDWGKRRGLLASPGILRPLPSLISTLVHRRTASDPSGSPFSPAGRRWRVAAEPRKSPDEGAPRWDFPSSARFAGTFSREREKDEPAAGVVDRYDVLHR